MMVSRTEFITERDKKIKDMFDAGIDDIGIAQLIGMTEHNVKVRRLRLGCRREMKGSDKDYRDQVIIELFEAGRSDDYIGKDSRVNLRGSTIRIERIRLGLRRMRNGEPRSEKAKAKAKELVARAFGAFQAPISKPVAEWEENGVKVQRFRAGYARGFLGHIQFD